MSHSLEQLITSIKDKIQGLVNNAQLIEAEELINQYANILPVDPEIFSIKAVIKIMQNRLNEAQMVIEEGLKLNPYYKDLLFNKSYLYDLKNNYDEAIKYFCFAEMLHIDYSTRVDDIIQYSKKQASTNLNILHGTIEIANQMHTTSEALKQYGINSKTVNYYPSYLGYKSDIEIDLNSYKDISDVNINTKILASELIVKNDIFHFHFGTTLTTDYSDLPLLNELNKKVVMQYWGSDVRLYSKAVKLNPYVKVKNEDEESIKRRLELISKYIPACFVDFELAEYVKEYHSNIHITRVAIDINKYRYIEEVNNKKLLIVHAPTSPEIKGTSFILEAIEDLKSKYDFDFKLVKGMSHEEARKIYEQADLIIDQILGGGYGVFAVESMALGKPVICWISDFMRDKFSKDLPIISANPDNIKDKIEYAIINRDMFKEIGKQGRAYVEKYHDSKKISKDMLQIYKSL